MRIDIQDSFLNLFTAVFKDKPLECDNKLNAFMLKITNNSFNYNNLKEELENAMITYSLSRHTYDELITQRKFGNLYSRAREQFRKAESNLGELGELLLYCLLEAHLKAPKLLTKLELKTASNDYVKGADGVHLLKLDKDTYQIIFGESKLRPDLTAGISDAFSSIKTMLKEGLEKITYEIHLVNSNLLKENVSDEKSYEVLKKILVPTENDEDLNVDYSFGIFLGFDFPISDCERRLNNIEFRKMMKQKVEDAINEKIPQINKQLKKDQFIGYNFYFYIVPFYELDKIRKQIIADLKLENI